MLGVLTHSYIYGLCCDGKPHSSRQAKEHREKQDTKLLMDSTASKSICSHPGLCLQANFHQCKPWERAYNWERANSRVQAEHLKSKYASLNWKDLILFCASVWLKLLAKWLQLNQSKGVDRQPQHLRAPDSLPVPSNSPVPLCFLYSLHQAPKEGLHLGWGPHWMKSSPINELHKMTVRDE